MLCLLLIGACQSSVNHEHEANMLMELDREFSRHSETVGANQAFLDYIDEQAVLLRANRQPIKGKETIIELYSRPDTGFILTWEPSFADVSRSGDLGYTYGIYTMETLNPGGDISISKGTYVTIWKKDAAGHWKFVLDTGNPGLERKKPDLE